jgi:hypothetical protein
MPITTHFRQTEKLVIFIHSGIVPDEEFLSFYRTYYEDPRTDKTNNILVDLRQTESIARSSEALITFADTARAHTPMISPRPRIAVIAPEDLSFGMARVYEAFSDLVPVDFNVFRAADAALAWLGMPENFMDDL